MSQRRSAKRPASGRHSRAAMAGRDDEVPLMDMDDYMDAAVEAGESEKDAYEFGGEKPFEKHDIQLWISDAVILCIEHFQYYALLLSLSEHWGWPIQWINTTVFAFVFNVDIWEFRKVEQGVFNRSKAAFIDTEKIGFNYTSYLAAWAVLMIAIFATFGAVYFRWMRKRPLHMLMYIAYWKRIMFLLLEALCFPFGVAIARVFHCRTDKYKNTMVMDVQNEFECFTGVHIGFMVIVCLIYFGLFLAYPFILSRWISEQVFSDDKKRHEGYLQLKEAEYEQGLDMLWDLGQYHLFSSFRRAWVYYNPLKFVMKLILLICFAASLKEAFWASAVIAVMFFLNWFCLLIRRPFRVSCFNFMIIISHLTLFGNVLIGNFMVIPPWVTDPAEFVPPSFLRMPTVQEILIFCNAAWLGLLALWIIYLLSVNAGLLCGVGQRLWPRLSYEDSNVVGEDTKKYLKAALKARHTLEHTLAAIPLFAPVHELAYQVKVINAYCREAEYIGDPTHDTLWDLLDELIEAHNNLSVISVFGTSGKNSIRETSLEFIKLMPSFRKRLAQREYDFALVPSKKRRLLLKLYVLGVFINGRKQREGNEAQVTEKLQTALTDFDSKSISDLLNYDSGDSPMGMDSRAPTAATDASGMSSRAGVKDSVATFLDEMDLESLRRTHALHDPSEAEATSGLSPRERLSPIMGSTASFEPHSPSGRSVTPRRESLHRESPQRRVSPLVDVPAEVISISSARQRSDSKQSFVLQERSPSPMHEIRRSESLIMDLPPSMQRPPDSRPSTAPPEGAHSASPSFFMQGSFASLPGQILEEHEHEQQRTPSSDGSIQFKPDNLIRLTTPDGGL